jgi:uncharacterized Fe-S cluster-containing radical SAM superfamily protein
MTIQIQTQIPVSKIGDIQMEDILKSSGAALTNGLGRICTVVKPDMAFDDRRDTAPQRMAQLFGGKWQDYNQHYILQVAGCPLECWYCYVDNLEADLEMDSIDVVNDFYSHWRQAHRCCIDGEVNVLHLMGGDPGMYPEFWKELRQEMDAREEFQEKVLFSDVIFVENHFYDIKPWEYMDMHHFMLTGCLKGTNRKNFLKNTGKDLFNKALRELDHYVDKENFYLSLINYDEGDLPRIYSIMPKERIDFLKVINYEVTKSKKCNSKK